MKRLLRDLFTRAFFAPFYWRRKKIARRAVVPELRAEDVIARHSHRELLATAEAYFARLDRDQRHALSTRPFDNLTHAPEALYRLGLLFEGLKLGRTMTVLDFGAGSCWLSHILARMRLRPIAVDVSASALAIGRELFRDQPIAGYTTRFSHFDGRRFDLPDESVERIICFDAFHHVPNPAEVLAEMYRVLTPGGIAGFSEPGRNHSRAPLSQSEMRSFAVLENDIVIENIRQWATAAGFGRMYAKPQILPAYEIEYPELEAIVKGQRLSFELVRTMLDTMHDNSTLFFLEKGTPALDSRSGTGLRARIAAANTTAVNHSDDLLLEATITNCGHGRWLRDNLDDLGVVRLGAHLYADAKMLDHEFLRVDLDRALAPGESTTVKMRARFPHPGRFRLVLDCVAEGVTWFESVGSEVHSVSVTVRPN